MAEHKWVVQKHDGVGNQVERCTNGTCTVRRVTNCSQFWQRAKGGHWRDTENENTPPCTGTPHGRKARA